MEMRPPSMSTISIGLLAALALALAPGARATGATARAHEHRSPAIAHAARRARTGATAAASPFAGRGMWIWYLSASDRGNLRAIIAGARAHHVSTLMVKAGDGPAAWSQFNPALVATLHASGLRVCAWQYVYGHQPAAEARVGATAVAYGADCLLIDAESQYEGKYVAAQTYMAQLRARIGAALPVALAGFPYVDYHPAFPYSVFLGPGGAQYDAPQMYWVDIGTAVDAVYSHTFAYNRLYGRPIAPIGQVYDHPRARDIVRFRQLARAYDAPGVSWWDWQEAAPRQWRALARPTRWLAGFTAAWQAPGLGPGSAGDLVVWAQEHLVSAGQLLRITGTYRRGTVAAVRRFQLAHGLIADGVIDAATWQALLAYPAAQVLWTRTGARLPSPYAALHAAVARDALVQPVPASAHLHARRDEIPSGVGAG